MNPPVGFLRDGNIHCGQGIYLPKHQFDALKGSKSPTSFIREASYAIFGKHVLVKSTPTGNSKKRKNGVLEHREKLNPTKLQVIQGNINFFHIFIVKFISHRCI